jgi:hypothetical protein
MSLAPVPTVNPAAMHHCYCTDVISNNSLILVLDRSPPSITTPPMVYVIKMTPASERSLRNADWPQTAQYLGLDSLTGAPETSGLSLDWRQTAQCPSADSLPGAPGLTGRACDWINLPFDPSTPGAQVHLVSNEFGDPIQGFDYQTFTPQATEELHQPWSNHGPSALRGDGQNQSAHSYQPLEFEMQGPGYGSRESGYGQVPWAASHRPGYGSQQHGYGSTRGRQNHQYRG